MSRHLFSRLHAGLFALGLFVFVLGIGVGHAEDDEFVSDEAMEALAKFQQGQSLFEAGQVDRALTLFSESLPIVETIVAPDSPGDMGDAYSTVARSAYTAERFELADQWGVRAFELHRKAHKGHHPSAVQDLDLLTATAMARGRYFEASERLEQALVVIEALDPSDPRRSAGPSAVAQAFAEHGARSLASKWYAHALKATEAQFGADHPNTGIVLSNQGRHLLAIGDHRGAAKAHLRAMEIMRAQYGEVHADTARTMGYAGWSLLHAGQLAKGRKLLEQSLAIEEQVHGPEHAEVADTLVDLSELYLHIGDIQRARTLLDRAVAINAAKLSEDDPDRARAHFALGALHYTQEDYDAAETQLTLAYTLLTAKGEAGSQLTHLRYALGYLKAEQGQISEGIELLKTALEESQGEGGKASQRALYSAFLGELYVRDGDLDAARPYLDDALAYIEGADLPVHPWAVYMRYALLAHVDDRLATAIFFAKKAVAALESSRREVASMTGGALDHFDGTHRPTYELLADLLIEAGRLLEAQQVLDLLKQAEFRAFTRSDPRGPSLTWNAREQPMVVRRESGGPKGGYVEITHRLASAGRAYEALLARKRQALREGRPWAEAQEKVLQTLRSDLGAARSAYLAQLAQLEETLKARDDGDLLGRHQLKRLSALQSTLRRIGEGTVLVHALITDDALHLLLTTPGVQLVRTVPIKRADLYRDIHTMRQALASPSMPIHDAAGRMYKHLVAPIREDLRQAGARTILFALDGPLRYLPPAALYDAKSKRYLVQTFAVAHYTEASRNTLERDRQRLASAAGLGLSKAQGGFSPLPAVGEELDRLVKQGPEDEGAMPGVVHLDEAFSRDALVGALEDRHPVVHVASHFAFRPGTEDDSYLLLGDGQRLSIAELRSGAFRFDEVELLTLSACETALSTGADGREIDGLATVAQDRGAQSVLASLWPVADVSTARLMGHMYQRLVTGEGKAQALRQAQLALLNGEIGGVSEVATTRGIVRDGPPAKARDVFVPPPDAPWAHPYHWAPFILMGHWR
ncbi:MAG: CHAT domain-containing protein [Bradymonadia bacterium]